MTLKQHLLSLGGNSIFGDQLDHDPDCEFILTNGKVFLTIPTLIEMEDHHCHWNVATLYKESIVTDIVIGYALNYQGHWFQHTWGMRDDILIETTKVNVNHINLYYGAILIDPMQFVEWCEQNAPGQGKVRRQGSFIDA